MTAIREKDLMMLIQIMLIVFNSTNTSNTGNNKATIVMLIIPSR